MRRLYYIIIGGTLLLLASCGQQYRAESVVNDFVEAYAEKPDAMEHRDFADLGTTRHISDSLVIVMHRQGAPHYKQVITYPEYSGGDLYYIRMRYVYLGDTLQNTFYLDRNLESVVAFK